MFFEAAYEDPLLHLTPHKSVVVPLINQKLELNGSLAVQSVFHNLKINVMSRPLSFLTLHEVASLHAHLNVSALHQMSFDKTKPLLPHH